MCLIRRWMKREPAKFGIYFLLGALLLSLTPAQTLHAEDGTKPITSTQFNKLKEALHEMQSEQQEMERKKLAGEPVELKNPDEGSNKNRLMDFLADLWNEPRYRWNFIAWEATNTLGFFLIHKNMRATINRWTTRLGAIDEFASQMKAETEAFNAAETNLKNSLVKNLNGTGLNPKQQAALLDDLPASVRGEIKSMLAGLEKTPGGALDPKQLAKLPEAQRTAIQKALALTEASTQHVKAFEAWQKKFLTLIESAEMQATIDSKFGRGAYITLKGMLEKRPTSLASIVVESERGAAQLSSVQKAFGASREFSELATQVEHIRNTAVAEGKLRPSAMARWGSRITWIAIFSLPVVMYGVSKYSNEKIEAELRAANVQKANSVSEKKMTALVGIPTIRADYKMVYELWTTHPQLKSIDFPFQAPTGEIEAQNPDLELFLMLVMMAYTELQNEENNPSSIAATERDLSYDERFWRKMFSNLFTLLRTDGVKVPQLMALKWNAPALSDESFGDNQRARTISELIDELAPLAARGVSDYYEKDVVKPVKEEIEKAQEEATEETKNPFKLGS